MSLFNQHQPELSNCVFCIIILVCCGCGRYVDVLDTAVCLINCMCRQSLERCMVKVNSAVFMLIKSKICVCSITHHKVLSVCHLQKGHRRRLLWDWETCDCMWGYVAPLNWYCGMCLGFHVFIMAVFQMGGFFFFLFSLFLHSVAKVCCSVWEERTSCICRMAV